MSQNDLPINQYKAKIAEALQHHAVIVVAGETGSGKSTQLPQYLLEWGYAQTGLIGHTQPRRIAARSVANRLSEELGTSLGAKVGYQVRFQEQVSADTQIKVMTEGILLNETQRDPLLKRYSALILDEVHERSLNVDFLLGYLKKILPKRPDLKLIITSATLEQERFAAHFQGAPLIEVEGRSYPIEYRYRSMVDEASGESQELGLAILDAVNTVWSERSGNILVFVPTERDVHEVMETLSKALHTQAEILPLFGRLSLGAQQAVFSHRKARRIIVSTNVAETSLTVPGIEVVIDSGLARLSRYDYRSKIQTLPIEPISQASAKQRAGRCGRVGPGICIRLYDKTDFDQRPVYTDPEIVRTNLASVILQMSAFQLGEMEDFAFLDPPEGRLIQDGYRLLQELQAMQPDKVLTPIGRKMANLPMDPRWARVLVAAEGKPYLKEILIILSALSVQDPREYPLDHREASRQMHQRYQVQGSDFMGYVSLWWTLQRETGSLSKTQKRRYCEKRFLSYNRVQEWEDVLKQLAAACPGFDQKTLFEVPAALATAPEMAQIHQCLLTGLLGQIGQWKEDLIYQGARHRKFSIFPGSVLYRKQAAWIFAAELVETSQCFARCVAKIDPELIEPVALHLVKRSYAEPHFEKNRQQVVAAEKVSLYGLDIVKGRKVSFGRIDPVLARELFIREGIVGQNITIPIDFIQENEALLAELKAREDRLRTRDMVVPEESLFTFYDQHLPAHIHDTASLKKWSKGLSPEAKVPLKMTERDLLTQAGLAPSLEAYPDHFDSEGISFQLSYQFDPALEDDGVTLDLPLAFLSYIQEDACEWLVPGMLLEKLTALIQGLPKVYRRACSPASEYAERCFERFSSQPDMMTRSIYLELILVLRDLTGLDLPEDVFGGLELDPHLFMNFRLLDPAGNVLETSRDLADLKSRYGLRAEAELKQLPLPEQFSRQKIQRWDFGDLPLSIPVSYQGANLKFYPTLLDQAQSVSLVLVKTLPEAETLLHAGVLRLLMLQSSETVIKFKQRFVQLPKTWVDGLIQRSFESVLLPQGISLPRSEAVFNALLSAQDRVLPEAQAFIRLLEEIWELYQALDKKLKPKQLTPVFLKSYQDLRSQMDFLFAEHWFLKTPLVFLKRYPFYLKGIAHRLLKIHEHPTKDQGLMHEVLDAKARHDRWCSLYPRDPAEVLHRRWLLEEQRLTVFAPQLPRFRA